jgi:hypothetical protein
LYYQIIISHFIESSSVKRNTKAWLLTLTRRIFLWTYFVDFADLDVDGRIIIIIIKWISGKSGLEIWTGFFCPRAESDAGLL